MKFAALTLGLLPLAAAGGVAFHERAEGGLSPKLDASMEQQARRAVEGLAAKEQPRGFEVVARAPVPQAATTSVSSSATPVSTAGLPNLSDTNAACQAQLQLLNGVPSNPSGKSVCYNIAGLNNQTGAFQAQVLVYNIGLPTGLWVNLLNKGETVSLLYPGGQVQSDPQLLPLLPADGTLPTLNASLLFTGQLNSTVLGQVGNVDAMHAALIPSITIGAETADGEFLNTTASNGEAAFINGLFSSTAFTQQLAQAAAASGTPFVLPGTTFGIFPTGFIVTAAWTLLFTVAVGLGTIGRWQFRMAYRSRGNSPARSSKAAPMPAAGGAAYDRR